MWTGHACAPLGQVIAATNRADILDPALMRSGRLDRKIEFPLPTEEARARILQVHHGSAWNAVILSLLVEQSLSIERIPFCPRKRPGLESCRYHPLVHVFHLVSTSQGGRWPPAAGRPSPVARRP